MRKKTIKWRIFKYNIFVIIVLIALTTIIFNISIGIYIENDIKSQLGSIASRAENTVLNRGSDFFNHTKRKKIPLPPNRQNDVPNNNPNLFRFYFILDRSLREPLSLINADYILLDKNKEIVSAPEEGYFKPSSNMLKKIISEIQNLNNPLQEKYLKFSLNNTKHIAIIKPVSNKNSFGLGWLVIYSSTQKVNQLQKVINMLLLSILLLSALIIAIISSLLAKKISSQFSSLTQHIRSIAERKFGEKINVPVDEELQDFVHNINIMSEKLDSHNKAQKTFLQNASHEFRTPLMSIQSYAEGIKHNVIEHDIASDIIIDESKRMTRLVEDLLYLSRLDALEDSYNYTTLNLNDLITACIDRINYIAANSDIKIESDISAKELYVFADEEKLSHAFTNILSNCIRYANTIVKVSTELIEDNKILITISDDGPGIDTQELPNIFDRFYKGKNGNFGLGLAISKNVISKHSGTIAAESSNSGAVFKVILPVIKG